LEWKEVMAVFEEKRKAYTDRMRFTTHLSQLILMEPELACVPGFRGCQAGIGQGCIGPEGEVMPCVMLPVVIGNIRDQPLQAIWNSSAVIQSLRERSHLSGSCGSCTFRDKCGGCRGVAYAYTGDYLAADPHCWLGAQKSPSEN
jgi:radical SAM protein with 4Fe4S-binding SPASM domain